MLLAATSGANPHPVHLVRPPAAPLSAMAQLGRRVFFDPHLSSSGRLSCASCHSPQAAFAAPGSQAVMSGGPNLTRQGLRAVPSLMYLERQPNFSVGPDNPENEDVSAPQTGTDLVPQGGLFWDGRADTLQSQAVGPLLNPSEMDNRSIAAVAAKLRGAPYAASFVQLFGAAILHDAGRLADEALFAVARYEFEDPAFHPYSSKYDSWLEGKARFTPAEERGYRLFVDPHGANCAGCHTARPSADGLPPLFTDHQFEALGVPRNRQLVANRDPAFFDLGICGPVRTDMRSQKQYCGMFLTPTLRNVATRHAFFHNGVYRTLDEVLDFYANAGRRTFDDLPVAYRRNVDTIDPPFDRPSGAQPALSHAEERDIIAFLRTLTDGYRPAP